MVPPQKFRSSGILVGTFRNTRLVCRVKSIRAGRAIGASLNFTGPIDPREMLAKIRRFQTGRTKVPDENLKNGVPNTNSCSGIPKENTRTFIIIFKKENKKNLENFILGDRK